jgi:putative nucleotidyltransferase with HDIG domain
MAEFPSEDPRLWPRRGIMATDAGRHVVTRIFWLTAGAWLSAVVLVGVLVIISVGAGWTGTDEAVHIAVGMIASLVVVLLAFVLLPAMGDLSRLGEDVRLLELCDPGAPLLVELMEAAPGTYNHSIMVGTLVDAAARQIGAKALLARVGAYYHDVGKVARPQFFAENQAGMPNPHDWARPEQSAFIITAHVREGAAMAERARIPRPVIDIIEQHHGTSLVTYFYRKAATCGLEVDQAPFRYEGVLPRTREAALVMLADAAEAVGRTLADCGPVQIETAVRHVVDSKLEDGQLARSGMTDADIEATVAVYVKMLSGQRHSRVAYPDNPREVVSERAGQGHLA